MILVALPLSLSQLEQPKKPSAMPIDKDIPYIRCSVCEMAMREAHKRVAELLSLDKPIPAKKRRFESSSSTGQLEGEVEDVLINLCNPGKRNGGWMTELDVVKMGSRLTLENRGPGYCRRECRTIAKVCDNLMEALADSDEDVDLGEILLKAARDNIAVEATVSKVCTKLTGVCRKGKTPAWPEGVRRKNEEHKSKAMEDVRRDLKYERMLEELRSKPGGEHVAMHDSSEYDFGETEPNEPLQDEL
eukprot:CAMPEP_0115836156 /NCGR_PEP_ID=MMETSP0287-20121206/4563_1 /TAXON_ID=412157 /ORGANISM="Chrysochromulina rotalis, Strain UIO044" /LENGTH=245 /DNA_ID=CAMNT_0003289633 /DNA_START=107 /DNA_END=844 /DNA_ORIENTATION=-